MVSDRSQASVALNQATMVHNRWSRWDPWLTLRVLLGPPLTARFFSTHARDSTGSEARQGPQLPQSRRGRWRATRLPGAGSPRGHGETWRV